MPYREVYKTREDFNAIRAFGLDYEGFIIGVGYTYMKERVIMPANQNGWNPISLNIPSSETFHTLIPYREYDTCQYAYEKSFMSDMTLWINKISDIVITKQSTDTIQVNFGNGEKWILPKDNSEIKIDINDTGSNIEVSITALNTLTQEKKIAKYNSLSDLIEYIQDVNMEGLAGVGFGIASQVGNLSEGIMNNRGAYLPRELRYSLNNPPPIVRTPLFNVEVPTRIMTGLQKTGKILGRASAILTTYQVYNDLSNNRQTVAAARVAVAAIAYGTTFIPYVGWAVAIGIGLADYIWGDEFYEWIDNKASELDIMWNEIQLAQ